MCIFDYYCNTFLVYLFCSFACESPAPNHDIQIMPPLSSLSRIFKCVYGMAIIIKHGLHFDTCSHKSVHLEAVCER